MPESQTILNSADPPSCLSSRLREGEGKTMPMLKSLENPPIILSLTIYHSSLQIPHFSQAPRATLLTTCKLRKRTIFMIQYREVEALH